MTVTDRGRPVARMSPLPVDTVQGLIEAGLARPPKIALADLPEAAADADLTAALTHLRAQERH